MRSVCPKCGFPPKETIEVGDDIVWHRCRKCGNDWETLKEEDQIYGDT